MSFISERVEEAHLKIKDFIFESVDSNTFRQGEFMNLFQETEKQVHSRLKIDTSFQDKELYKPDDSKKQLYWILDEAKIETPVDLNNNVYFFIVNFLRETLEHILITTELRKKPEKYRIQAKALEWISSEYTDRLERYVTLLKYLGVESETKRFLDYFADDIQKKLAEEKFVKVVISVLCEFEYTIKPLVHKLMMESDEKEIVNLLSDLLNHVDQLQKFIE